MMRYQRVSPDCLPHNNGKKPSNMENGRSIIPATNAVTSSSFETSKAFRFRSPSRTTAQDHHQHHNTSSFDNNNQSHHETTTQQRPESSPSPSHGGDILLQWGHKKRSRVTRTEIRAITDDSSSSSSAAQARQQQQQQQQQHQQQQHQQQQQQQQGPKPQRRVVGPSEKLPITVMPLPPPPPPPPLLSSSSNGRARKGSFSSHPNRNLEDRSGIVNGSPSRNYVSNNRAASRSMAGKRSPPQEKNERKISSSGRSANDKPNSSSTQADRSNHDSAALQTEREGGATHTTTAAREEKMNVETMEWPRIHIALSRKEKEDDFLVMKGTKLPQRPKKRAKNIDRALQYCFPGMWLSDLTRNRYEVRERKCAKKQKRRGLKGMESVDSDSE